MMNNEIDINEIMKTLEDKIKKGLAEKSLTVSDISLLIGEHIEKAKEKILADTSNIIENGNKQCNENNCKDCGKPLKKTRK